MKWLIALAAIWLAWRYLRPAPKPKLSPEAAARRLLGVPANADEATIRAAHRRLLAEVHPDRGGSADEARRANAARDLLLTRLG